MIAFKQCKNKNHSFIQFQQPLYPGQGVVYPESILEALDAEQEYTSWDARSSWLITTLPWTSDHGSTPITY